MPWFQNLCRNVGLAIHNVKSPTKKDRPDRSTTQVTKREVDEQQVDENITLRRTTIEEIEMKPGADKSKLKNVQQSHEQDANT